VRWRAPGSRHACSHHRSCPTPATPLRLQWWASDPRVTRLAAGSDWNRAADAKSKAVLSLHATEERRKSLSRFATRIEIAAHDDGIARANEKVIAADEKEGRARELRNRLVLVDLPPLTKRFEELAAQELRLYCSIYKLSYTDPEFGLVVPAGMTLF
jgi:hypothetical protein